MVLYLLPVSEEERHLLLYLQKQLAAASSRRDSILCFSAWQLSMGSLACRLQVGCSSCAAAQGPQDAIQTAAQQQQNQTAGGRNIGKARSTSGAAMEATVASAGGSCSGRRSHGHNRGDEDHQSSQGGPDTRGLFAGQCSRAPCQSGRCSRQASYQEPAQPNASTRTCKTASAANTTGQGRAVTFVVSLCQRIASSLGKGRCSAREPHGPVARTGSQSGGKGAAGPESHSGLEQGRCGDSGERRGRYSSGRPLGRLPDPTNSEEAQNDLAGAQKSDAGNRACRHAQKARQGNHEKRGGRGTWWSLFRYCGYASLASAPQLGCTSSPSWCFPTANTGVGELREQPACEASARKDFARQVDEACLCSRHSVVFRTDYKSPYQAQLVAHVWHLLVNLQDGLFFCEADAMLPEVFRREWGHSEDCDDELKRDMMDIASARRGTALHGQFKRVESHVQMLRSVEACSKLSHVSCSQPCTPVGPVKGGFCRPFPDLVSSLLQARPGRSRVPGRKVSFCDKVAFWFPSGAQLTLSCKGHLSPRDALRQSPFVAAPFKRSHVVAPHYVLSQSHSRRPCLGSQTAYVSCHFLNLTASSMRVRVCDMLDFVRTLPLLLFDESSFLRQLMPFPRMLKSNPVCNVKSHPAFSLPGASHKPKVPFFGLAPLLTRRRAFATLDFTGLSPLLDTFVWRSHARVLALQSSPTRFHHSRQCMVLELLLEGLNGLVTTTLAWHSRLHSCQEHHCQIHAI